MPYFTQAKFPRLWLLMQRTIGGNGSKKALSLLHYRGERRVLEIGCSVGNIAEAFIGTECDSYTGIDIDTAALVVARRRFESQPKFSFREISLSDLCASGERFDYVLFAGILHHVDDKLAAKLLAEARMLVAPKGRLIVSEPEALTESDGWVFRQFYKLEQGQFLRERTELEALIRSSGASIESSDDFPISPGIVARPYVARFNLIAAR